MPNGIDLLLADHEHVDGLFTTVSKTGDPSVIGQILGALTAHDDAEHAALYPLAGEVLGDDALIQEMAAAHSAIKAQMELVRSLEGPALTEAVGTLRDLVKQHVAAEEKRLLPSLQEAASKAQLETMGARILTCKQRGGSRAAGGIGVGSRG